MLKAFNKNIRRLCIIVLCVNIVMFSSCLPLDVGVGTSSDDSVNNSIASAQLKVAVIDVGQGDAILIKTPKDRYILIDSGSKSDSEKFLNYIKSNKIPEFYAVIGTHPHEDHIGNMDDIINNYKVQNVYLPKVTQNTKTFKDLMDAIKNKKLTIKNVTASMTFKVDDVNFEFLAPNSTKYDDINNYSAVLKVTYGSKSFLFMGDAQKLSENEMLSKGFDLKSDVIKIGHHGSSTSSGSNFLKKVNPKYAVISCGKDNVYGHPHKETIKILDSMNIKTFRTDEKGTIIFICDGKNIKVSTNK